MHMIVSQVKSFLVVVVHLRRLDQARSNDLRKIWALKLKEGKRYAFEHVSWTVLISKTKQVFLTPKLAKQHISRALKHFAPACKHFARAF